MARRAVRPDQKFRFVLIHFLSLLLFSCIDSVEPDFEFRAGIVFVEGLVSTLPEDSYVTVSEFSTEFNLFRNLGRYDRERNGVPNIPGMGSLAPLDNYYEHEQESFHHVI
ncbi:MAG: hypothetical protein WBN18_02460 [Flavobacteriaceae bacterium]